MTSPVVVKAQRINRRGKVEESLEGLWCRLRQAMLHVIQVDNTAVRAAGDNVKNIVEA